VKLVHLPCSLKVYERHSGAPSTFLFVALKDLPKNFKGPACVAVTLVVNHTLQTHQTLVVSIADGRKCIQNLLHFPVTNVRDAVHMKVTCMYIRHQTSILGKEETQDNTSYGVSIRHLVRMRWLHMVDGLTTLFDSQ